ncbi:MAG: DUF134 domain-containing protein [Desulfovibrio sp.]|nr:DUF134 domain-containing protein [Desulfovibrio sp.]
MARPRHCRFVGQEPSATYFKPCGVPLRLLDEVILPVEGLEALRLSDLEGLGMAEAAKQVRVSRFSYARTLAEARRAVAQALVQGKALRVQGGQYAFHEQVGQKDGEPKGRSEVQIIAISSEGPSLEDALDPRYGRAGGFIIARLNEGVAKPELSYLDNGDAQLLAQGAGIATTEHLAKAGVTVVLSGFVGPKAFASLEAAGIKVVQNLDGLSCGEALNKYLRGEVQVATAANHPAGG